MLPILWFSGSTVLLTRWWKFTRAKRFSGPFLDLPNLEVFMKRSKIKQKPTHRLTFGQVPSRNKQLGSLSGEEFYALEVAQKNRPSFQVHRRVFFVRLHRES